MPKKASILLLTFLLSVPLLGQEVELPAGRLRDAINFLEANSSYIFNYDANAIKGIMLSHPKKMDLKKPTLALEELLRDSSLDFEINDELILLYEARMSDVRICGKLVDKISESPLPFAHVFADEHYGTWTNEEGLFDFSKPMWKNEKVFISYLGYKDRVLLAGDFKNSCRDLDLEGDALILSEEVVVRDYVLPSITKGQLYNGYQVNLQTMHKEMGVIEKDLFKNLQFLPGVNSLDESAGNLSIRGSDAHQNLILWEGTPLYGNGHFFGMISSINPFIHRDVELFKTVHHAKYDNRIGGVIDVKLADEIPKEIRGGLGTTLTEAHADLELPIFQDKFAFTLGGRKSLVNEFDNHPTLRSYGDKLFQASTLIQEDVNLEENESEFRSSFYDFNAKIYIKPSDRLKLSASLFRSSNQFFHEYAYIENQIQGIDSFNVDNLLWNSKLNYTWSTSAKTSIEVSQSFYQSEYVFTLADDLDEEEGLRNSNRNSIEDLQIRLAHSIYSEDYRWDFGYVLDRKNVYYFLEERSLFEADFELAEEQFGNYHHLFTNFEYELGKYFLNGGLRASRDIENLTYRLSPRFSISRPLRDAFNVSFSAGLFHQYIRQVEDYSESQLNINNRIWYLGDEDIMSSKKFSLGINYQKNNWLFEVESYFHTSDNIALLNNSQSETLGIEENGMTLSRGLELLVKKRWKNLNSALSYHLGYLDVQFVDMEGDYFPANNDQRHNLSWLNYYHFKNWSFGLQYYYRSGLPYTKIDAIVFIEEEEEDYYQLEIDAFNSERLANFHRLDASISYGRPIKNGAYLDIQFFLMNFLNFKSATSRNEFLTDIDPEDDDPEILSIEKFQLARTPQILLRLSF